MDAYHASTRRLTQASLQGAPDSAFVPGPPAYFSAGDASTSSAVVVASPSGSTLPVVTPPPGVPTNGLSIFTVLEPIKGLWECQNRCGIRNLNRRCSLGSWLLDPLAALSSGPSILQTIVQHRAGRRPRRARNMTLGAPTARLDSRHGSISAVLRMVAESPTPATATIRSTTRSGNIVLELVSQSRIDCDLSTLPLAVQVSKSPTRMVHFDAYSRSGKFKTQLFISVSEYPKRGLCSHRVELLLYYRWIK